VQHDREQCKYQQDMDEKAGEVKEKEKHCPKQNQNERQKKKHSNPAFHTRLLNCTPI
jgi:hypothetical protein